MLNTEHLMQALEAAGADRNVVYLSVPITTGKREIALMKELGVQTQAELRTTHRARWLRDVVGLNAAEAQQQADELRRGMVGSGIVVDPSRMHVEGWEQDDYNAFWVELMRRHVRRLVASDGWAYSQGARGEVGLALALGLQITDLAGRAFSDEDLERDAEAARHALEAEGWPRSRVAHYLPPLRAAPQLALRPSPQSEVFYWLGWERKRQVEMFGPDADDNHTKADGLSTDGWWVRQLTRYWRRAEAETPATSKGRLALARYTATACALLESAVRLWGPVPSGDDDRSENG